MGFTAGRNGRCSASRRLGSSTATANSTAVVSDLTRLIGAVSAAKKVAEPPLKLPDLVAMAFADSVEHGGVPRESFIKDLVLLLRGALVFVA